MEQQQTETETETEIEVPSYFLCPISLQIMEDPVTTTTGITYDRQNIERWLTTSSAAAFTATTTTTRRSTTPTASCPATICPVTGQSIPPDLNHLTPNITLRRLIHSWKSNNSSLLVRPTISETLPLDSESRVTDLLRDFNLASLKKLDALLASQTADQRNQHSLPFGRPESVAIAPILVSWIIKSRDFTGGLQEAFRILHRILITASATVLPEPIKQVLIQNHNSLIDSITWLLTVAGGRNEEVVDIVLLRCHAITVANIIIKITGPNLNERLPSPFLSAVVGFLRTTEINKPAVSMINIPTTTAAAATTTTPHHQRATKDALCLLTETCQRSPRNRLKLIVEANAVHELIELELSIARGRPINSSSSSNNNSSSSAFPYLSSKRVTELVFGLLATLCSCADGRARFLSHPGGVALVSKRMLRVTPATDHRALQILAEVARCAGTREVLREMLVVGAVSKLCMVIQADCDKGLKDKAREVLRLHYGVWNGSPCIQTYLVTRYSEVQF